MSSVFFELKAEKTVEGKLQPFDETMIINKLQSIRAPLNPDVVETSAIETERTHVPSCPNFVAICSQGILIFDLFA